MREENNLVGILIFLAIGLGAWYFRDTIVNIIWLFGVQIRYLMLEQNMVP